MAGRTRDRRRDESGAVAILCALLAVVLLGIGAIVVDIGQAYAKRSLLQTDVDLAVLAAARELTGPGDCNPEVITKATEFLNKADNAVPAQYPVDLGGTPGDQDGYIRCHDWRVDLWAPNSHVDYTLGRVLSDDEGLDVQAHASAQFKSLLGPATLPFFAVQGCDNGAQSIRNPSGPVTVPEVPPLDPTSSTVNNAKFTITPPTTVASGTTSASIELTGTGLKDVDAVTFTGAAGPPYHYEVAVSPPASSPTGPITVPVPSAVLAVEDVWYVRVKKGTDYSAADEAQPFAVGDDKLYCDARNEGNFGTIEVPRDDTNNANWLAYNIIKGIQPLIDPHPLPNGQCDGQPGSILSNPGPVDHTNCLASETGLKISATTDGLVSGVAGLPGRLDADSTSGCSRNGTDSRTSATIKGTHINDDLLSCFITNGAHISDLVDGNSVGTHALSGNIYDSPRFFTLPVLDTDPSTGKKYWPVVGFVPGFITDQDLSATHDAPGTISTYDGLDADDTGGIKEINVVLLSQAALPEFGPARGGESDYTGSGPKTLVLVE